MPEIEPSATPAASEPAGQRPTIGSITSDPTSQAGDPAGQTPAANAPATQETQPQSEPGVRDPEAKARADAEARYRRQVRELEKRLAEFEEEKRKAEEAKLSETERLQKRLAEYQAKESQATLRMQERIVRAEVRAEAIQRGINPALAARLIDFAAIEYDEDTGDPKNIGDLLAKAVVEYGIAPQKAAQPPAPATPDIGGTNPPRQGGPLVITANEYLDSAFRAQFYKTHGMDITKAVNAGKVTIV